MTQTNQLASPNLRPHTADLKRLLAGEHHDTHTILGAHENDDRINGMWPDFESALKAAGAKYEMYKYPGTQHGFHNNSTPRYKEAAAKLSWERMVGHFKKNLV